MLGACSSDRRRPVPSRLLRHRGRRVRRAGLAGARMTTVTIPITLTIDGVAVDGHDRLGPLHPDCVLHGPADAAGDVDGGLDGLARLADLHRVRNPARVDHRPAGADRATDQGGKLLEELEVLVVTEPATAADDD